MDPTSHFKTRLNDLRTTMKLRALVSDLHSQVHFLDRGIHDEEQRTGILDLANIAYPIKSSARADIESKDLRMIANIGDQYSDLAKGTPKWQSRYPTRLISSPDI